ncbi:MAG TPA: hypothetical protein VFP69_18685 [Streptomyces sp.]|jgi:hypothetical protein|nr:hypothetical protein [Streptomyces sp.]
MTIPLRRGAAALGAVLLGLVLAVTAGQYADATGGRAPAAAQENAPGAVERLWSIEGDEQSAAAGTKVPVGLKVRAVDGDFKPVQGVTVTFSTPGPGLKFPDGSDDATAVTDGEGYATAPGLTAAGEPGPDLVTASVPTGARTAFEITIT